MTLPALEHLKQSAEGRRCCLFNRAAAFHAKQEQGTVESTDDHREEPWLARL